MKFVHTIDAFHLWVGRPSTGRIPTGEDTKLFLEFRLGVVDSMSPTIKTINVLPTTPENRAYLAGVRVGEEWLSDRGVRT